jgi:hypothetical protein
MDRKARAGGSAQNRRKGTAWRVDIFRSEDNSTYCPEEDQQLSLKEREIFPSETRPKGCKTLPKGRKREMKGRKRKQKEMKNFPRGGRIAATEAL